MHLILINEIVNWIENNLHKTLTINVVATRAGYSLWHFQRVFKNVTGQNLADYIRQRRLTKAATEIILTSHRFMDVAINTGFDSQQTFTRIFTRHFGISPKKYRLSKEIDFSKLLPIFSLNITSGLRYKYVTLPDMTIYGKCRDYIIYRPDMIKNNIDIREESRSLLLDTLNIIPSTAYGISKIKLTSPLHDSHVVSYALAVDNDAITRNGSKLEAIKLPSATYISFNFRGSRFHLIDFVSNIYLKHLPELSIIRGAGVDIERYNNLSSLSSDNDIDCEYLIPVVLKKNNARR